MNILFVKAIMRCSGRDDEVQGSDDHVQDGGQGADDAVVDADSGTGIGAGVGGVEVIP